MDQTLTQPAASRTETPTEVPIVDERSLRQLLDAELLCVGGGASDVVLG